MAPLLFLLVLCASNLFGQSEMVRVRGGAEDTTGAPVAGVRFEFLLAGSPEKKSATTGAEGKYSLTLSAGTYEILLHLPGRARGNHRQRARCQAARGGTPGV